MQVLAKQHLIAVWWKIESKVWYSYDSYLTNCFNQLQVPFCSSLTKKIQRKHEFNTKIAAMLHLV